MAQTIYQWGWFVFGVIGTIFAIVGAIRGDVPFFGPSKFSDSVFGRVAVGLGMGSIWPVFLLFIAGCVLYEHFFPSKKRWRI